MPLHDWSTLPGWDGLHQVWIVELLYWIKPRLPTGYRAFIGTTPTFAIGGPGDGRPDVGDSPWPAGNGSHTPPENPPAAGAKSSAEPDVEIAVATLEGDKALFVERQDRLIAAVELVSPRNKDRQSACAAYTSTYAGYLLRGVHLLLVDVHRRPSHFSFADQIAIELGLKEQPPIPPPFAMSYRVGAPAPNGGRFLGMWRYPLAIGEPLPIVRLPLSVEESIAVDLEQTYGRAAEAAYLS